MRLEVPVQQLRDGEKERAWGLWSLAAELKLIPSRKTCSPKPQDRLAKSQNHEHLRSGQKPVLGLLWRFGASTPVFGQLWSLKGAGVIREDFL